MYCHLYKVSLKEKGNRGRVTFVCLKGDLF